MFVNQTQGTFCCNESQLYERICANLWHIIKKWYDGSFVQGLEIRGNAAAPFPEKNLWSQKKKINMLKKKFLKTRKYDEVNIIFSPANTND